MEVIESDVIKKKYKLYLKKDSVTCHLPRHVIRRRLNVIHKLVSDIH